uniref:Uncharacterized protein n=1 Tax=Glossina palpalis gambiensis TaxID=67801 RepID=A0A1B0B7W7_9MUSC
MTPAFDHDEFIIAKKHELNPVLESLKIICFNALFGNPFSNGTTQSSKVASITNTSHLLQSNAGLARKICMAVEEKSQPYTLSCASRLYFKIGKSVFPTPQPSSKILLHSCVIFLGASSGNSMSACTHVYIYRVNSNLFSFVTAISSPFGFNG